MDVDSLYSFELFVESLFGVKTKCTVPSVAFRILDFPMVNISFISQGSIDQLKERSAQECDLLGLRNKEGEFVFQTGKSCLFKMEVDSLYKGLKGLPVQLFLFDVWEVHTLVGSALLPIVEAINHQFCQISGEKHERKRSSPGPTAFSKREELDFYNIMGTKIGTLKFIWNLTDYGSSLLRHLPLVRSISENSPTKLIVKVPGEPDIEANEICCMEPKSNQCEQTLKRTVEVPDDNISHLSSQMLNSSHTSKTNFKDDETPQNVGLEKDNAGGNSPEICTEIDNYCNSIIRPPPLYFVATERKGIRSKQYKLDSEPERRKHTGSVKYKYATQFNKPVPNEINNFYEMPRSNVKSKDNCCQTESDGYYLLQRPFQTNRNDMPILSGLVKDILQFSSLPSSSENKPEGHSDSKFDRATQTEIISSGDLCKRREETDNNYKARETGQRKVMPLGKGKHPINERLIKHKKKEKQHPKLQIKLTKTHRLRCLLNSKYDKIQNTTGDGLSRINHSGDQPDINNDDIKVTIDVHQNRNQGTSSRIKKQSEKNGISPRKPNKTYKKELATTFEKYSEAWATEDHDRHTTLKPIKTELSSKEKRKNQHETVISYFTDKSFEGEECRKDEVIETSKMSIDAGNSWQDSQVWEVTESEERNIDEPLPSVLSPLTSKSTRRQLRPKGSNDTSDFEDGRGSSSIWSSHRTGFFCEENNVLLKNAGKSPKSVDVEELYNDDFCDLKNSKSSQSTLTNVSD